MKFNAKGIRLLCALVLLIAMMPTVGIAAPVAGDQVDLIGIRAVDVKGDTQRIGVSVAKVRPVVLVFLDTACPVSTRYVPTLNKLHKQAHKRGIDFYGVLSDPAITWKEGMNFVNDFNIAFPVIMDTAGDLALRLGPRVSAEAFVISGDDILLYRGRIDDRFAAVSKLRTSFDSHDLRDLIKAVANNKEIKPYENEAVGCIHHTWSRGDEDSSKFGNVTYTRHVAPLLEANCVDCHQQGGVAPFSLENYKQSKRRHEMISYVTHERIMPPWKAVQGFGDFRGSRRLSTHQIALLKTWSENGAELGDADDTMPIVVRQTPKWRLGKPDMVLKMPEPFQVPADGDDIYRYFVLPTNLNEDQFLVALDFSPGDSSVVHHVNYMVDFEGRAHAEDAKDDEPGFSVFGTGSFMDYNAWGIGGWTPGADPYTLDDGVAIWFPKNGDFVLEVHYSLSGQATTDQSEVALYFAKDNISDYVDGVVIGTQDLEIPPGDDSYWRQFSMEIPAGLTLTDVTPHMHFLGREFIAMATLPDGSEIPIIRISDWDFRWQNTYSYRKPVYLPADSRIDVWVRYDNTAANLQNPAINPKVVKWGWETTDEMAELWIGFIPDSHEDRELIVQAADQSFYRSAYVSKKEINQLLARLPEIP